MHLNTRTFNEIFITLSIEIMQVCKEKFEI